MTMMEVPAESFLGRMDARVKETFPEKEARVDFLKKHANKVMDVLADLPADQAYMVCWWVLDGIRHSIAPESDQ